VNYTNDAASVSKKFSGLPMCLMPGKSYEDQVFVSVAVSDGLLTGVAQKKVTLHLDVPSTGDPAVDQTIYNACIDKINSSSDFEEKAKDLLLAMDPLCPWIMPSPMDPNPCLHLDQLAVQLERFTQPSWVYTQIFIMAGSTLINAGLSIRNMPESRFLRVLQLFARRNYARSHRPRRR